MNKIRLILLFAVFLFPFITKAETITDSQGVVYNVLTEPEGNQSGTCEVARNSNLQITNVKLPEIVEITNNNMTVEKYTLVGFELFAFTDNTYLQVIDFSDCNAIKLIDAQTFKGCTSLSSISFPNSIESIERSAFEGCKVLNNVVIPNNVTSLGSSCFAGCKALSALKLGQGLSQIGMWCFDGCSSLKELTVPANITSIYAQAFKGCSSLSKIIFQESDTSVFVDVSVTGDAAGAVGTQVPAFYDCPLEYVYMGRNVTFSYNNVSGAFSNQANLTAVVIADGVTEIYPYAFANCTSLSTILLPPSMEYLDSGVFSGCNGLTKIDFNNGLKVIDLNCFAYCSKLPYVSLPASLQSVGRECFTDCSSLSVVTCYAQNVPKTFDTSVFKNTPLSTSGYLFVPVEAIDSYKNASNWRNIATVLPIGMVESITLPEEIVLSGDSTPVIHFDYQPQGAPIPDVDWTIIPQSGGNSINFNSKGTTTVSLPLLSTGSYILTAKVSVDGWPNSSESSQTLIVKNSDNLISFIDNGIIYYVSSENSADSPSTCVVGNNMNYMASSVVIPAYASDGNNTYKVIGFFDGIDTDNETTGAFCQNTNISSVTFEAPENIQIIGTNAFMLCSNITDFDLASLINVTEIGNNAFAYAGLSSANLSSFTGLISIGSQAFYGNVAVEELDLTACANLESIGWAAFGECGQLKSVNLQGLQNINTLEPYAFFNCQNLESVILPASLETVELNAFLQCVSLNTLICYAETPPTTSGAFYPYQDDYEQLVLYVPGSSITLYEQAQYWKSAKEILPIESLGSIDEIHLDNTRPDYVDVIAIDGKIVAKKLPVNHLKDLSKGIYIIVSGKDRIKISI